MPCALELSGKRDACTSSTDQVVQPDKYVQADGLLILGCRLTTEKGSTHPQNGALMRRLETHRPISFSKRPHDCYWSRNTHPQNGPDSLRGPGVSTAAPSSAYAPALRVTPSARVPPAMSPRVEKNQTRLAGPALWDGHGRARDLAVAASYPAGTAPTHQRIGEHAARLTRVGRSVSGRLGGGGGGGASWPGDAAPGAAQRPVRRRLGVFHKRAVNSGVFRRVNTTDRNARFIG